MTNAVSKIRFLADIGKKKVLLWAKLNGIIPIAIDNPCSHCRQANPSCRPHLQLHLDRSQTSFGSTLGLLVNYHLSVSSVRRRNQVVSVDTVAYGDDGIEEERCLVF